MRRRASAASSNDGRSARCGRSGAAPAGAPLQRRVEPLAWALSLSACVATAALSLSCATQAQDNERARAALLAEDHTSVSPAPTPTESRQTPPSLPFGEEDPGIDATTQRILTGVAASRGLPVTGTVHVGKASRPELLDFIQEEIHRQVPQDHFELLGRLQIAFGVIPLGADPEVVMLGMFGEGVQGLYDPASKSFLIGDYVPSGMREMVVGHEIVHALQDMHFNLENMQAPIVGHSDRESARTFLIEGDAQASYYAWAARDQGLDALTPQLLGDIADQSLGIDRGISQHPFLAKLTMMPYTEGAATIVALARARGWSSVDGLFKQLPTTTEQMLHLDKLLAVEPAVEISLPTAAFQAAVPGFRAVYEDDLGEAFLLALMSTAHGPENARRFAAGWGGDRFCVFEPEGTPPSYARASLIAGVIHFDTERDATEAAGPLTRSLSESAPAGALLSRHKQTLLYVLNTKDASQHAEALMNAMVQGVRIEGKQVKRSAQR